MAYKGFTQVELRKPKRSMFDMSHEKRISTRIGKLTPIFITETIPNDTFDVSSEVLIKLAPMVAPIFHRLNMYVHFFFVPQRLLWTEWEQFITGGRLGDEASVPPPPPSMGIETALNAYTNAFAVGSLADYLGMPPIAYADRAAWANVDIDARPFAAFYRCWFDYYRDRNYVSDNTPGDTKPLLPLVSGAISGTLATAKITELVSTRYRAWQHEYFSSALPWTQRGSEVLMPMEFESSNVFYYPSAQVYNRDGMSAFAPNTTVRTMTGVASPAPPAQNFLTAGATNTFDDGMFIENVSSISGVNTNVSINDFRRAVALQQWLERNALGGSRLNESIWAHFGRRTSDARLQRAEYLGGGKAVVQISEIMTTAYSTDAGDQVVPPANPTGRGSAYSQSNRIRYNCEEWGFIVGVLSIMPTAAYMQGIPRMFSQRISFLDYPWPTFAHLGEQEVYDYELYATPTNTPSVGTGSLPDGDPPPVFGYQSRYADWKTIHSSSHGDFRTSLDFWHLTRKFSGPDAPPLGANFVTFEDSLQDRIFNVSGVDTVWLYVYNQVRAVRSLPYFGTPALV